MSKVLKMSKVSQNIKNIKVSQNIKKSQKYNKVKKYNFFLKGVKNISKCPKNEQSQIETNFRTKL